jgi:hypothetical protein
MPSICLPATVRITARNRSCCVRPTSLGCSSAGVEGIVSKRLDRAYGVGRCKHWIKTKNPAHPAYSRVRDQFVRVAAR